MSQAQGQRDLRRLNLFPGMHAYECPECGYRIPMSSNRCGRCGADLELKVEVHEAGDI